MAEKAIHKYESSVASYNRSFSFIIKSAKGSIITDIDGRGYIDFFSGAGANNYGHNPEPMKQALIEYIQADGINNSLDMATGAKFRFIDIFYEQILEKRGYSYKLQFTGPTGTNAVEAALKLVRKNTGKKQILAFGNGFHGVSLGSLAATSNPYFRNVAGVELRDVSFIDYDEGDLNDSLARLEQQFNEAALNKSLAGAIVECIQGEGGVNVARPEWLRLLRKLTADAGIPLVIDDIQAGCGRSGQFFSFEESGIIPDIVTLSKSISGYGSPMSLVLIAPELDTWQPAQHNGTFRGNNHAFVTAATAIETYWQNNILELEVNKKANLLRVELEKIAATYPDLRLIVKGRGFLQGLAFADPSIAEQVSAQAFRNGLIIERAGKQDEVVKFMPALTIDKTTLYEGISIIDTSIREVIS